MLLQNRIKELRNRATQRKPNLKRSSYMSPGHAAYTFITNLKVCPQRQHQHACIRRADLRFYTLAVYDLP